MYCFRLEMSIHGTKLHEMALLVQDHTQKKYYYDHNYWRLGAGQRLGGQFLPIVTGISSYIGILPSVYCTLRRTNMVQFL